MKQDPFDPSENSNWTLVLFIGTVIAAIVIGIWFWAHTLLAKAFHV